MTKTIGYAAQSSTSALEPFHFERRKLTDYDVKMEILYSGICHSDIHFLKDEWSIGKFPMVAGHEVLAKVTSVGDKVKTFKVGDIVAPSGIIDSCRECDECLNNLEQYCQKGFVFMYNTFNKYLKGENYGGFSKQIVVDEKYVIHIPKKFKKEDYAAVVPLMCAGLTPYSALKHLKIGKGHKVGIVGIGGLGHLAVKIAHALGAHVVAITTTPDKKNDTQRLGASESILSTNADEMKHHLKTFDFILSTVPVSHDLSIYLELLKLDGTMSLLGLHKKHNKSFPSGLLSYERRALTGSVIGSTKEMKEMLEFCLEHNILADVEVVPIQKINESFKRVVDKKVRYRCVIDMSSL